MKINYKKSLHKINLVSSFSRLLLPHLNITWLCSYNYRLFLTYILYYNYFCNDMKNKTHNINNILFEHKIISALISCRFLRGDWRISHSQYRIVIIGIIIHQRPEIGPILHRLPDEFFDVVLIFVDDCGFVLFVKLATSRFSFFPDSTRTPNFLWQKTAHN